jgi:hypothetical protein
VQKIVFSTLRTSIHPLLTLITAPPTLLTLILIPKLPNPTHLPVTLRAQRISIRTDIDHVEGIDDDCDAASEAVCALADFGGVEGF